MSDIEGYLSHSRLSMYLQCGMKFKLLHEEGHERGPQGALISGDAVHQSIAAAEENGWHSKEAAKKGGPLYIYFQKKLDELIVENGGESAIQWAGRKTKQYPDGEDVSWWQTNGPAMLRRYTAIRRDDIAEGLMPVNDEAFELKLRAETDFGWRSTSYVDALFVTEDGEYLIRDYKTGRVSGSKYTVQLPLYAWALKRTWGNSATFAQYAYLRGKTRDKQLQTTEITQEQVELVNQMYEQARSGIENRYFPICPSNFCKACEVREKCPYGKTLEV